MRVPKVCRLCMSKDNLVSIFAGNSFNSDDIFQGSGVQVKTDDGLPQKICTKCSKDLKHTLDFREKCKTTEKQLIFMKMSLESATESCDSVEIKQEPVDEADGEVRSRISIKFEKTDSEDENEVKCKQLNERITCKHCHRSIYKRRIKLHMVERHPHLDKSMEKCDLCLEFVSKQKMTKHLLFVHKKGFKCIYCKENCNTSEGLMKHIKTCSETCDKKVLYTREHIECNICHISLTRGQLYRHKRSEHSNLPVLCKPLPNDQKVMCDICEIKFYSIHALNNHKRKHYSDEHFEITSIDNSTTLDTKKDILRDRKRLVGPKRYKTPEVIGVSKVLVKALTEVEQEALAKWLVQMQDRQFVLDKTSIFDSIKKMIGDQEVPQSHIICWINDFLDKHPEIEIRETKQLEVVYSKIKRQIKKWFRNMEEYLVKHQLRHFMDDRNRVFTADERLFFTSTYRNKYKLVQDKSHNILFAVNAAAVLAPPMIVFAYREVPEEVMENIPDKWAVRRSDNGIMCCNNFYEYITEVFTPWLDEADVKRPVILLLNAHTSYLTLQLSNFCSQHGVELIALYPYAYDITPMELALFKPINNPWQKAISKNKDGEYPEVKDLAPLLREVVSEISVNTIKKGFIKAGLFPIDFSNIEIPQEATVKRYDYLRNTCNVPKKESNEMPEVKSELREADSPKLKKVSKVYLSKKQLLEKKEREEKDNVKIKVEVTEESESQVLTDSHSNEPKALKRKSKEKLRFESSESE